MDPRSAEEMVIDIDYSDDGYGNLDAQIQRYLEVEIPYLIIYTKFNPSTPFTDYDSGDDLLLVVNKN